MGFEVFFKFNFTWYFSSCFSMIVIIQRKDLYSGTSYFFFFFLFFSFYVLGINVCYVGLSRFQR